MAIKNVPNYTSGDGFGMPLNIRRGNPNPLDNTEVWENATAAMNYAQTSPIAYVGQIISWYSQDTEGNPTVKSAQIINEDGDLLLLSSGSSSGSGGDVNLEEITNKEIDDIFYSVFGS